MRHKERPEAGEGRPPAPARDGSLAELAKRQHGVVSASQLHVLGYSRNSIARAARSGRLHRVHRGVYAVGHSCLSWHGHHHAAVLACAPGAVLSHASAGALWGLLSRRHGAIHVTAPTRRHAKDWVRIHHARLATEDLAICEAVPATAVPRTLLDLAADLSPDRLVRCVERAEELRLFDLRSTDALLARAGKHRGVGRLRRALRLYRQELALTRSGLERRFLELIRRAELPTPSMNHFVEGYELDAYWPRERFAVELDSYGFHRSRAAFERDRLRQEELKLAGIEMVRVTDRRVADEPRQVVERVGTLLQRRRLEVDRSAKSARPVE